MALYLQTNHTEEGCYVTDSGEAKSIQLCVLATRSLYKENKYTHTHNNKGACLCKFVCFTHIYTSLLILATQEKQIATSVNTIQTNHPSWGTPEGSPVSLPHTCSHYMLCISMYPCQNVLYVCEYIMNYSYYSSLSFLLFVPSSNRF